MCDRGAHRILGPGSGDLPAQDLTALRRTALERMSPGGHGSSLTSTIGAVVIQGEQGPFGEYGARAEAICGKPLGVRRTAGRQGRTTSARDRSDRDRSTRMPLCTP